MAGLDSPASVNILIGRQIRQRRTHLKMTQDELARLLNVTYQQVQKYEAGTNRVSAEKLLSLAAALKVPVGYFYEGADALQFEVESDSDRYETLQHIPSHLLHENRQSYDTAMNQGIPSISENELHRLIELYVKATNREKLLKILESVVEYGNDPTP